jgi:hypothetical protein
VCSFGEFNETARAQEVTNENVDGIVNLHRLQTTVVCSGAIKPGAIPRIKEMALYRSSICVSLPNPAPILKTCPPVQSTGAHK